MDRKDLGKMFWLSLGFGLALGGIVFAGMYLSGGMESKDPRIKKVEDLITEAEKLISISKNENK